jgi:hypothetical protein
MAIATTSIISMFFLISKSILFAKVIKSRIIVPYSILFIIFAVWSVLNLSQIVNFSRKDENHQDFPCLFRGIGLQKEQGASEESIHETEEKIEDLKKLMKQ